MKKSELKQLVREVIDNEIKITSKGHGVVVCYFDNSKYKNNNSQLHKQIEGLIKANSNAIEGSVATQSVCEYETVRCNSAFISKMKEDLKKYLGSKVTNFDVYEI